MAWQGQSGPEDAVGGISATVTLDTSGIDPGLAALQSRLAGLGERLEGLGPKAATATRAVKAGMDGVGESANVAGFRMQAFAQTLDDLQYVGQMGLRPILNNLIQISPALGVAALAADQLVKNMGGWKEILSDLGVISPIETAADEMKRLGDQTQRTANEQDRLNRLKRGEAAVEQVRTGDTKEEKAAAEGVQEAVVGADFRKVRDMVMAAQAPPTMTPEDVAALKREKAFQEQPATWIPGGVALYGVKEQIGQARNILGGYGTDARKTIDDRLAREANANAERLIGEAKLPGAAGESARAQLAKYAAEAGGDMAGFALEIGRTTEQGRSMDEVRGLEVESAVNAAEYDRKKAAERLGAWSFGAMEQMDIAEGMAMMEEELGPAKFATREEKRADQLLEKQLAGAERGNDLNWRMDRLLNPDRKVETLTGEEVAARAQGMTGLSEEAKRLHEIVELEKQIAENTRKLNNLATRPR